ncbi:MAG: LamG-like jellyroll fold domain-containing protein [Rhodospirillales bacterium]
MANGGWNWGNPCGLSFSTFFQWGRDGVNTGAAKPGYTAYTYPHPLTGNSGSTGDTTAPTVSLTAPASGATVTGTVAVSADASDNVAVAGVQFKLDGADLGAEDAVAPYSITWATSGASSGSHTLTAVARDAAGNTRTSAARSVTVSNSGVSAPAITSQPQSATVSVGQSAIFSVTASGSSPISYQWQRNNSNVGGATSSSYTTPATAAADSGTTYRVIVSNTTGSVTSNNATLTVTAQTGSSGPSGSYNFNEGSGTTTADRSGNNRPGTLVNGPAWVTGKNGKALGFDGSNDYVSIGNRPLASTFTVSAWLNNPSSGGYETIASFGSNRQFSISNGSLAFWDGSGSEYRFGTVPTGSWQHVAYTYDGTRMRAYLNGAELGTPFVRSIPTSSGRTLFGAWPKNSSEQGDLLSGSLDDIRIYDRALTQAEIQTDGVTPVRARASAQNTTAKTATQLAAVSAEGTGSTSPQSESEAAKDSPPSAQPTATGAVYYVDQTAGNDSNPGTMAQPWKNVPGMNGTAAHTGGHSLSAGDTVYLDRDDTWTTTGSPQGFYLVGGVRYIGDEWEADGGTTGRRAKIRAGNDFNENGVVRFRDHPTEATVFKGFEVDANSMSANGIDVNHGFWSMMNGATKRIENVEVHHVYSEQAKGEYKYGIAMSNFGGNNGILENVEVVNCSVHDVSRDAIVLYPSDDPNSRIGNIKVQGCEVYNTGQDPGYLEGHGIVIKGWVYDSTIENNYIHNVDSSAVFISGPENDGTQRGAQNLVIRNNILTTQDNNGIIRLYKKGAKDLKVYGNLLLDNNQTGGLVLQGNSGTLDLLVYNNTFYNTFVDLIGNSGTVNSFEFKNNIVQYSSNQLRNAGSIKSASNNLLVASNPGLKNPADKPTGFTGTFGVDSRPNTDGFTPLTGSSAIDQGVTLAAAFNGSINSVVRPQGAAWDIGAYEYGSGTSNPIDTAKPSAPTGLTASAASGNRINLSWSPATDNVGVTGYRLERCTGRGCSNFAQIVAPAETSYGDSGLSSGTVYRYRVRAADAAGNLSAYSQVARATARAATLALGNVSTAEAAEPASQTAAESDKAESDGDKATPSNAATDLRLPLLLATSEADAGSEWSYVDAATGFADAVVIAGTPSVNEEQPGVVRVSNVSGSGFEMRFQEWDYLQRLGASSHAPETIPYAVMQPGRHRMGDGTVWEVGSFPLDGGASWRRISFSEPFESAPLVFLTVQTANDPRAVTVRARGVTGDGFEAALLQEEAQREGHGAETVGYVAVRRETAGGLIDVGGETLPYIVQSVTANDRWLPVLGQRLKVEEEQSKDLEVRHPDESLSVLALGGHMFAQQVSDNSADPTALRRLPPVDTAMEWGVVRGVDSAWTVLPLARKYTNPVIVARPVSAHDPAPGVIRLRQVAADRLEIRFQEWNDPAARHGKEDTFYMVAEAGRHTLGDLAVEAGGITDGQPGGDGWRRVSFTGGFGEAPVVLSSVETANGTPAVSSRVANVTGSSFVTALDLRPGQGDGPTGERIGWIAIERGESTIEGRQVEAFADDIDGSLASVSFPSASDHRYPTVVADINGGVDPTPVFLRYANPTSSQIRLRIARQELTGTTATWHQKETAGIFVGE